MWCSGCAALRQWDLADRAEKIVLSWANLVILSGVCGLARISDEGYSERATVASDIFAALSLDSEVSLVVVAVAVAYSLLPI